MSEPGLPIPSSTYDYHQALPAPEGTPPRPRYWIHGLLLAATCFTTLVVGARLEFNFRNNLPPFTAGNDLMPFFPVGWALAQPSRLLHGIPFSAALLIILLSHEMGHYLLCRYYGVRATLPFFIPAPTLIGTLGAVIRIKAPIRSRAALFDIGIAGPIAGFVMAIAWLAVAIMLSKPVGRGMAASDLQLGYPAIFHVVQNVLRQFAPNRAVAVLPLSRVYLHPIAVAAWVGMYATALNLLPSGQLDGGHIVYALAPGAHRMISWATVIILVGLGAVAYHADHQNYSWWVWAGLITVMNVLTIRQRQAPDHPVIPASRWALALLAALMLVLTFTRSPFHIAM
ncbi:MAG TPA: site-2 protease family protein [Candidatus Sulfotelmatobacter sp.]|nr:site-2 protease family protein [Candidatus Sulfotelmatobacter sp.]